MKIHCLTAVCLLLVSGLWGQAAPDRKLDQGPTQSPMQTGTQDQIARPADPQLSRPQTTHQFELEIQQLQAKLDAMRATDAAIKDPAVKKHLQLDAELWAMTLAHMNAMASAMLQMQRQRSSLSPAAQMYRRQMLRERTAGAAMASPPTPQVANPATNQH